MNQAAARKDYLAYEKAAEQANELNKNVRQLKEKERLQVDYDSQFDAPVSTARLTESVKGLFGRKKPQEATQPIQDTSVAAESAESTEYSELVGFISPDAGGEKDSGANEEMHGFLSQVNAELVAEKAFQEVSVDAMMRGEIPIISEQEAAYFYNTDLRYNRPTVEGWTPDNETHRYMVHEMVDAITDAKYAMFENAGINKSVVDRVQEQNGGEPVMSATVGSSNGEDEGIIGNYDEGWLYAYQMGFDQAKKTSFPDVPQSEYKKTLLNFMAEQESYWKAKDELQPNTFNAGAVDCWQSWRNYGM